MSADPEVRPTVIGEGMDLRTAVASAAEQLGVSPRQVEHKLDLAWFRSATGASVGRSAVRIIAWTRPEGETSTAVEEAVERPERVETARRDEPRRDEPRREEARREPRAERSEGGEERPRRSEDRPPRSEERPRRSEERPRIAAPEETTPASDFAATWFSELTRLMGLTATVSATGNDERVRIRVKADAAGRLIGRRGTTLAAIRHLLALSLATWGDLIVDVDVDDERDEGRRSARDDNGPRRDEGRHEERRPEVRRDDRGREGRGRDDRGARPERRPDDRGPRGREGDRGPAPRAADRGPRRDEPRREGRGYERRDGDGRDARPRSAFTEEKLQELARRAADKAIETGKPITIKLPLNAYDRRIIHVEVGELSGVESQSVVVDDVKYVQVLPASGG